MKEAVTKVIDTLTQENFCNVPPSPPPRYLSSNHVASYAGQWSTSGSRG